MAYRKIGGTDLKKTRIICIILIVAMICLVTACGKAGDSGASDDVELTPATDSATTPTYQMPLEPTEQETPKYTNATAGESDSENGYEPTVTGVIIGDVLFNGIAVSRIFLEPFADVLGEPLKDRGTHFTYGDLRIVISWGMTDQIVASTNFNQFEIDGVTLDMTLGEVIAAFGNPLEFYEYPDYVFRAVDDRMIRYHVSSPEIKYMLEFWFVHPYLVIAPDDESHISSIRIVRYGL
jgi:hypothetical protein